MATDPPHDPLDPGFTDGLAQLPMAELRRRRGVANKQETDYSYVRRLVQAPLDMLGDEARRRAEGRAGGDVSELVGRLPGILADHVRAPGLGRLPLQLDPGDVEPALLRRLEALASTEQLSALPSLGDEELRGLHDGLAAFERELSATRAALHRVIDALTGEIVRRYRDGEADPGELVGDPYPGGR